MIRRLFSGSCCSTPSAMCFWATAFMVLYGAGLVVGAAWPAVAVYRETYTLAALGVACAPTSAATALSIAVSQAHFSS